MEGRSGKTLMRGGCQQGLSAKGREGGEKQEGKAKTGCTRVLGGANVLNRFGFFFLSFSFPSFFPFCLRDSCKSRVIVNSTCQLGTPWKKELQQIGLYVCVCGIFLIAN